jgi:membrane protease subunit (stomatin/prohibitin family)
MALIDRIKFDGPPEALVWKFRAGDGESRDNITLGAQLVVNESQEALFFKQGKALDLFGPGTHTLSTGNMPILQKLVNLPFGGNTPFTAEVFYINKTAKLDYKWGTRSPIQVEDPKLKIIVSVGCFGQFGLRVSDSRTFVTQIVGTMPDWSSDKVVDYFRGVILEQIQAAVGRFMVVKNLSVMQAAAFVKEISAEAQTDLRTQLSKYGLELLNFYLSAINIAPEELKRIQEVQQKAFEFDRLGDQRYATMRSFDTMQAAANNPGAVGTLMGAGLGLGLGAQLAHQAGGLAIVTPGPHNPGAGPASPSAPVPTSPVSPPSGNAPAIADACAKCGQPVAPGSKFCAGCGEPVQTPKTCPSCHAQAAPGAKFCGSCGAKVDATCSSCNAPISPGAKFCSSCGAKT